MTGRLGFAQTRGWQRERRDSCRMNIYIAGVSLNLCSVRRPFLRTLLYRPLLLQFMLCPPAPSPGLTGSAAACTPSLPRCFKRGQSRHAATGTGLTHPGDGCYLGCDPEGIHFASTTEDLPTAAHEVGHLAEIGTASSQDGFINNPQVGWIWEACR